LTFLIDPPLLMVFSLVSMTIGSWARIRTSRPVGSILVVLSLVVIMFTSSSLYFNCWWLDWFWQPFSPAVTSGRDLMVNSGLFAFDTSTPSIVSDALAVLQIALYPLWSYLGVLIYQRLIKKGKS
jgi:hypothetical protein